MHISNGQIVATFSMTITERAALTLSEFRMKPGEIVIGRRGDMGRCAVVERQHEGWLCGTGSIIIRPETIGANFLQRLLSSPPVIKAIEDASVGTTMINLNHESLAGLSFSLPPIPEQTAIAAVLTDMDAELALLEQRLAKTRDLKQGMMQELLTGRTRLVGPQGATA